MCLCHLTALSPLLASLTGDGIDRTTVLPQSSAAECRCVGIHQWWTGPKWGVLPSQDPVYYDLGLLVIRSHDNKGLEVILKWFNWTCVPCMQFWPLMYSACFDVFCHSKYMGIIHNCGLRSVVFTFLSISSREQLMIFSPNCTLGPFTHQHSIPLIMDPTQLCKGW